MATGLSTAQAGHAPHIKAWIPPPRDQSVGWSCSCMPAGGFGEDAEERETWSWGQGGRGPARFGGCSGVQGVARHRCIPCAGALLALGRFHEDGLGLETSGFV